MNEPLPQSGGSYTRDPETGELHREQPAQTSSEPAAQTAQKPGKTKE